MPNIIKSSSVSLKIDREWWESFENLNETLSKKWFGNTVYRNIYVFDEWVYACINVNKNWRSHYCSEGIKCITSLNR